jgi:type III restriction enzyme
VTDTARIRQQLKARLSLRKPQADALDILGDVLGKLTLDGKQAAEEALALIQATYPSVEAFERAFPSLCFSLATGVGKTRLMGAFIALMYLAGRSKHFFVLAPNTTIYDKLKADFTPGTPKYVFKGIAEFASLPPVLVTGETWDQGRGVRGGDLLGQTSAIINVFNVDKINSDKGRVRKLHEYIGQSYFDYLASLPDLVLLMDEAHRYRAKAGMKAVEELKPVLGLELTATPRSTGAGSKAFKNIILDYRLGQAMADGYVKEPAVATRKDFSAEGLSRDELEEIKLKDGVHCHEHVKAELDIYARQSGRQRVHPFMMVVAQDTVHAEEIRKQIISPEFFGGRYADRVIRVDSKTDGELADEATQRLISLENDAKTDIVIHVNKLGEGWDVTNLYTIVPLRASASDILTEQTLGRGLRLPYGARTGVEAVDTLTVIAHDRFADVVAAAQNEQSIVRIQKTVFVGEGGDVSGRGSKVLEAPSHIETSLTSELGEGSQAPYVFDTPEERDTARVVLSVIQTEIERELTRGRDQLLEPAIQDRIVRIAEAAVAERQGTLEGVIARPDVRRIAQKVSKAIVELTIDIPEIVVLPTREVNFGFRDFDLVNLSSIAKQPIEDEILIQQLRTENRTYLARATDAPKEPRPENHLIRHLIAYPEVDYDTQSELLFKLAGQMLARLRDYLPDEDKVENVLIAHGRDLARFVFAQMKEHYWETPSEFIAKVTGTTLVLRPQAFNVADVCDVRPLTHAVTPAGDTKRVVFGGFTKCCYPYQKFQSEPERAFAALIDSRHEPDVIRWMKPGPGQFAIDYGSGASYEPDFVIETATEKLIVEVKRRDELVDPVVLAKARAASAWVRHATNHAKAFGQKPWVYVLIPHDEVTHGATLQGLVAKHARATTLT